MSPEQSKYIKNFKQNNPIYDCLGSTGGRWKWRRYLDGIDLRYGHATKKSAEMDRAKVARGAWELELYYSELIPCPICKKPIQRRIVEAIGGCVEHEETNYPI